MPPTTVTVAVPEEPPQVVEDRDGNPVTLPVDRYLLTQNFKALQAAHKMQHEIDHPREAGLAKGSININQQVAVGMSWSEITGDVPDKAQEALDQLGADKEADHEGTIPDIPRGVSGSNETKES